MFNLGLNARNVDEMWNRKEELTVPTNSSESINSRSESRDFPEICCLFRHNSNYRHKKKRSEIR